MKLEANQASPLTAEACEARPVADDIASEGIQDCRPHFLTPRPVLHVTARTSVEKLSWSFLFGCGPCSPHPVDPLNSERGPVPPIHVFRKTQNLPNCQLVSRSHYSPIYLSFVMLLAALSWQYLSTMSQVTEDYVQTGEH
ncbi:FDFT1 [Cervus elaphus hippelaphus]|uniref:FDFT1 n=1 Tax=Cervus elaphus hippelaphus TaxID=46360 RepID=A0A212C5C8_CEREH|nr:FDFT1 [Cervus elaphus hippelaphus]